jgi:hypothetical protein
METTHMLRTKQTERGQVLPMVTIMILFLMGMVGLAIEVGMAYYGRQSAHIGAESAAMAAAEAALASAQNGVITCGGSIVCQAATQCAGSPNNPPKTNSDNACLYAASNGFGDSSAVNVSVAANTTSPAPAAPGVAVLYWATVSISKRDLQLFSRVFSPYGLSTGAQATAAVVGSSVPAGCIYVLNPTAANAFSVQGSSVNTTCGIYVNSSNSQAMSINGNPPSGTSCVSDSFTSIVGNYANHAQCSVNPTPKTGQTAVADPLANLPAPTVSSTCNQTDFNWSQGSTSISPGVYCGGINISGGTVTFQPGQYILDGGGLTIDSANTTVTGTGVTFYNTAGNACMQSYGPLTISGQPKVTLSAPSSGPYTGILFFTGRSQTSTASNQINGATSSTLQGTIYISNGPLLYTGQSSSGTYTGLVTNTLTINGATNLLQDPTGQYTGLGSSSSAVYLIE